MATMKYSDITPRTQVHVDRRLLKRAMPNNILGQFGQSRPLPKKTGLSVSFRRYNKLANATTPLTEGVTPTGKILTKTDIVVATKQYGDYVTHTDVIVDNHEDPVVQETVDILGEQAGETLDVLRAGVLKAGTNVLYADSKTSRVTVDNVVTRGDLRSVIRILKAQEAKRMSSYIKGGTGVGTSPIAASYIAVCHSDMQPDLEQMTDWVPVSEYPAQKGMVEGEAGAIGELRFVFDNNVEPWADAGGTAATNSTMSTTGTQADIYPILIFGKDAYGLVPFAGKNAVSTYLNSVGQSTSSDPLAQRGTAGWKTRTATVILNDLWMLRVETAAKG